MALAPLCIAADSLLPTSGDGGSSSCIALDSARHAQPSAGAPAEAQSVPGRADRVKAPLLADKSSSHLEHGAADVQLLDLAASWPELAALRPAASSPNVNRLRCALTSFASHTRVEFASALLEARKASRAAQGVDESALLITIQQGRERHEAALDLLRLGVSAFSAWNIFDKQAAGIFAHITQLVALGPGPASCEPPCIPEVSSDISSFPLTTGCFLAALAAGWSWDLALEAFAHLEKGFFHEDSLTFVAEGSTTSHRQQSWLSSTLVLAGGSSLTFFLAARRIVLFKASFSLMLHQRALASSIALLISGRQTRFLPEYIRLPRDSASGLFDLPTARVTAVVERQDVWLRKLGPLDGTARAIVLGHFSYPRRSWTFAPS